MYFDRKRFGIKSSVCVDRKQKIWKNRTWRCFWGV